MVLYYKAAIALGSNMGDRVGNFLRAIKALQKHNVKLIRLSRLYESAAAYVTDQPAFLNAAALVETPLGPRALLTALKAIEAALGRELGGQRFGPRPIDLDIVFMNDLELDWPASGDTRAISVPHPRWQERGFVKAPLADLYQRPVSRRGGRPAGVGSRLAAARALWEAAGGEAQLGGPDLRCVLPMGRLGLWSWQARPQVMGVLNVTPDSFSDGGRHASVPDAVAHARRLAAEGADILDVGGQSTRPGAAPLGAADEAARVVPVLRALAADEATRSLPLSVDTFHAEVAAAAVAAGATMVNDVSGGGADGRMLATVAALGVPYVLMHSRGTPQTMQAPENTAYTDVVAEVAAALQRRGELAVAAGIEPWRLILDPGLGFAKTAGGNLQLIAGLPRLTASMRTPLRGLPLLAGPSRKGFLGRVTGREVAEERDAASAAAAALCVANGAHIVRAHNVAAVRDAALVGDAVRRGAC